MRPFALIIATALLIAGPLSAQTFPTDDAVLRRIWTIGMDSSHTQPLAQVFFDSIGPRLSGTGRQKMANDWAVKTYTAWGIAAKNEQVGTWRGWRRGHSHIDLMTPRVRTLEGTMLGYSPGTAGKDVVAGTVILPRFADSTAFVQWLPQAKGKLVLVSAPMPTCRPVEEYSAQATPPSKVRMDSLRRAVQQEWAGPNVRGTGLSNALGTGELGLRLEKAGVAGIVTSRAKDAWGTIEIFETYNTKAPAIALSCEDYGLVYRLTDNKQGPTLRLNLDAQLLGEQPIFNTIGTLRGSEKPNEYVVLSAHFDSWDGASGATDNGTGTLTMMEAMRLLKQAYPNPKRTIVVGHWTAEEHGLVGSKAYAEDHADVREGMQALFNQDNGTGRIVNLSAGGLPNAAVHIESWMSKLPTEFTQQVRFGGVGTPATGGSDNASFACHGAPAFSLGSTGFDYGSYTWHTNRDTFDKVWFDDLKANATLTAMLAYLASEDPTRITREQVDAAAVMAQRQAAAAAAAAATAATAATSAATAATPSGAGRGRGDGSPAAFAWPMCTRAPRATAPRLK